MVIAYVLGGADCVFEDIKTAAGIVAPDMIIGINDVVAHYPGDIDVMVTLHPKYVQKKHWLSARKARGYSDIPRVVSHVKTGDYITEAIEKWHDTPVSGSSGLYAVKVALEHLNVDKVILCGVPMTTFNCHFFTKARWGDAVLFQPVWKAKEPLLRGRVKSMSGFTADLLGMPTGEWANDANN